MNFVESNLNELLYDVSRHRRCLEAMRNKERAGLATANIEQSMRVRAGLLFESALACVLRTTASHLEVLRGVALIEREGSRAEQPAERYLDLLVMDRQRDRLYAIETTLSYKRLSSLARRELAFRQRLIETERSVLGEWDRPHARTNFWVVSKTDPVGFSADRPGYVVSLEEALSRLGVPQTRLIDLAINSLTVVEDAEPY